MVIWIQKSASDAKIEIMRAALKVIESCYRVIELFELDRIFSVLKEATGKRKWNLQYFSDGIP